MSVFYLMAPWGFLFAQFPLFFFYQTLVAASAVPQVLPAWWSIWNLIGCIVLVPLALKAASRERNVVHFAAVLIVFLICLYAVLYFQFGAPPRNEKALLLESGKLVLGITAFYCAGYLLRPQKSVWLVFFCALASISASTMLLQNPNTLTFVAIDRWDAPIGTASYQWFAQACAMTAIIALALAPDWRWRVAAIAITVPALYALASRSEFVGFVGIVLLWVGIKLWRRRPLAAISLLPATGLAIAVFLAIGYVLPSHELVGLERRAVRDAAWLAAQKTQLSPSPESPSPESPSPESLAIPAAAGDRHAEVLQLSESESWQERLFYLHQGWKGIVSSPIFGDYAGQMSGVNGRFGNYIHNILSAWRQYGLLTFGLYVALCFGASLAATLSIFRGASDQMSWLAFFVTAYVVALVLFLKSVFWPMPALAWGLFAAQIDRRSVQRSGP